MCDVARDHVLAIADPGRIHVDVAYTGHVAIDMVRKVVYDLILLDLYRYRELMGYEVLRRLNEIGCSTEVILMTRFDLEPAMKPLMRAIVAQSDIRVVSFLDKRESRRSTSIREEVSKRYALFDSSQLKVTNLELAGRIIDRRRGRYARGGVFPLRSDVLEINAEVERLLRVLYVELSPPITRSTDVTVTLEPIERRGLSAAVVVNATVVIGEEGLHDISSGHKTVLKIGPKPDILEEASRYREFVRYGVELSQRVELFGCATRDSLGALVYSFAGGLHGKSLASLDDLLLADIFAQDVRLSRKVLHGLFATRTWYSVGAPDLIAGEYFEDNYHTDLLRSWQDGELELQGLSEELDDRARVKLIPAAGREEAHFEVSIGDSSALTLPTSSVLGIGSMWRPVAACLVHGDMHAGNVMVEVAGGGSAGEREEARKEMSVERVCLIDFRNAGPGPRTMDAVALESSIRLADSEAVCRQLNASGESGLGTQDRILLAKQMVARLEDEVALYRAIFDGVGEARSTPWCLLASEVLGGLRDCFNDVSLEEYLRTSIRYTIRQLGFKMLPVARARILTWLAAQYELLPSA